MELGTLANSGTGLCSRRHGCYRAAGGLSLILIIGVITGEALTERFGFRSGAFWSKTIE